MYHHNICNIALVSKSFSSLKKFTVYRYQVSKLKGTLLLPQHQSTYPRGPESSSIENQISYVDYRCQSCLAVRSGKKGPNQETGLGNRGHMKVQNDIKLILNNQGGHSCSFRTNLVSFRTFRCPLFPKPVSWFGLFLPLLIARLYKSLLS